MKYRLPKLLLVLSILALFAYLFLPLKQKTPSPLVPSAEAQACRVDGEPCEIGTPNAAFAKCCTGYTCNTDSGGINGTCVGNSTKVDPSGQPSPSVTFTNIPSQFIVGQTATVVINNCPRDGYLLCSSSTTTDISTFTSTNVCGNSQSCTREGDTVTCPFKPTASAYWRVKAECGDKVYTSAIRSPFSKAVFVSNTQALTINLVSAVQWPATTQPKLLNLTKPQSGTTEFPVTLSKFGGDVNSSFKVKLKSDGTCTVDGYSNAFVKITGSACTQSELNANFYNVSFKIDTSKLDFPTSTVDSSGQPFPAPYVADTYTLTVTDPTKTGSKQTIKKDVQVYNNDVNKPKITITSKNTVTDPAKADPDQWNKPKAEFNFFEGDATVEATGCPIGTDVEFTWWKGKEANCNDTTCNPSGDHDNHTETVKSSGKASFTHNFSTDGKSDIYAMTAKCVKGGGTTKVLFRAFGQGEEYVTFPVVIPANTEWPVTLGGLDTQHHLCYYIRVAQTNEQHGNEDFNIPINGNDSKCGGEDLGNGKTIIDDDKKPFVISRLAWSGADYTWGNEVTFNLAGLPAGYYKLYLYSANAKSKGDWAIDTAKWVATAGLIAGPLDVVLAPLAAGAWVTDSLWNSEGADDAKAGSDNGIEFCVDVCRNDGQEFPPGKAPCLIGTDKEGNVVDARPESEQKDNPYKYTNKDGKTVTAQPGTRDDIVTCTVVPTAFGNIDTSPQGIVKSLLQLLLSAAGSIALILIIIAGYKIMTSRGNPEQVQDAKEQLTSAIVGLLFIIFSVVILQTIGVDLLHIPGFKP